MSMGGPGYQAATQQEHARHGGCLRGRCGCRLRGESGGAADAIATGLQRSTNIGNWSLEPRCGAHGEGFPFWRKSPQPAEVTAAMLIRAGWTGVDDIFSGPEQFFLRAPGAAGKWHRGKPTRRNSSTSSGKRYEITRTNIKKWTVGSPIQAPLDALAGFFQKRSFTADDVKESGCADRE